MTFGVNFLQRAGETRCVSGLPSHSPRFHGHLKAAQWCDQAYAAHRTPVIHVQGGFKVPMETGRNLEHTTERHQRGFKVPMETGSLTQNRPFPAGTSSAPCSCPAGFSRCAGRCLLRLDQKAAYEDAEARCAEIGGHLLVPRTEAENQCAFQLRVGMWSWLGVSDRASEGVYEGADGCGPFPSTGGWWREGDPDNWLDAEHCVGMINDDQWNDRPCGDNNYPLCQLSHCLKTQCP